MGVANPKAGEAVALLHGLARTHRSMAKLESALAKAGYETCNIDYPSRRMPIEALAEHVRARIVEETAGAARVHIVTHSLGGIVVRQIQCVQPLDTLGRVVMLAPPNCGSEIVDALRDWPPFRWWNGPAGLQLGTERGGFVDLLGPVDFELGVVAGERSLDPVLGRLLPSPHDGKVSVASARVEGMADFRVIRASHTFIMRHPEAIAQTLAFLRDSRFAMRDKGAETGFSAAFRKMD